MNENDYYRIWWETFIGESCRDCFYKKTMDGKNFYPSPFYKGEDYKSGKRCSLYRIKPRLATL